MFTPLKLKNLDLRNRIVMAPMTRCFSSGGVPRENVAEYYARRAKNQVGLIISEGTWVDDSSAAGYPDVPTLYGDEALAGWKHVLDRVHQEGGAMFAQLFHVGSYRKPGFDPEGKIPCVGPSPTPHPGRIAEGDPTPPEPLSEEGLQDMAEAFARSAVNAKNAGFDGVELHGAHGYLLDQFMWTETNRREDRYGGALENRIRFPVEVIRAVRKAAGSDFPIAYRFSQWKLRSYDARMVETPQELEAWLLPLRDAGVDLFHASTYRIDRPEFEGSDLGLAGWTRKITATPTIAVGGVGVSTDFAEERQGKSPLPEDNLSPIRRRLEAGEFDLVAVGRALLGDPEWALKVQEGRFSDIRPYSKKDLFKLV